MSRRRRHHRRSSRNPLSRGEARDMLSYARGVVRQARSRLWMVNNKARYEALERAHEVTSILRSPRWSRPSDVTAGAAYRLQKEIVHLQSRLRPRVAREWAAIHRADEYMKREFGRLPEGGAGYHPQRSDALANPRRRRSARYIDKPMVSEIGAWLHYDHGGIPRMVEHARQLLAKKRAKGVYDARKAQKLAMHIVEAAARGYAAGGPEWWRVPLSKAYMDKPTRSYLAAQLVREWRRESKVHGPAWEHQYLFGSNPSSRRSRRLNRHRVRRNSPLRRRSARSLVRILRTHGWRVRARRGGRTLRNPYFVMEKHGGKWHSVGRYHDRKSAEAEKTRLMGFARTYPLRVKALPGWLSVEEARTANRMRGHHFFDPDTMRFFRSRIASGMQGGRFFVTSEKPPHGPRHYTVRFAKKSGDVQTVGDFGAFHSRGAALTGIKRIMRAKGWKGAFPFRNPTLQIVYPRATA